MHNYDFVYGALHGRIILDLALSKSSILYLLFFSNFYLYFGCSHSNVTLIADIRTQ